MSPCGLLYAIRSVLNYIRELDKVLFRSCNESYYEGSILPQNNVNGIQLLLLVVVWQRCKRPATLQEFG